MGREGASPLHSALKCSSVWKILSCAASLGQLSLVTQGCGRGKSAALGVPEDTGDRLHELLLNTGACKDGERASSPASGQAGSVCHGRVRRWHRGVHHCAEIAPWV